MSYATILHFDPATEDVVYALWDALAGLVERPLRDSGVRPHVTLANGDHIDQSALLAATATFAASARPFRLVLSSIGLFATDEGVLFLGVTVSRALPSTAACSPATCATPTPITAWGLGFLIARWPWA